MAATPMSKVMALSRLLLSNLRACPAPRFRVLSFVLFVSLLIGSVAVAAVTAPPTYAKKKQRSASGQAINNNGTGYSIEASFYEGRWDCRFDCFGTEDT